MNLLKITIKIRLVIENHVVLQLQVISWEEIYVRKVIKTNFS